MNWSYGKASFGGMPVRVITRVAQGGPVPVNPDSEFVGCPVHEADVAEHLEAFFDGAAVGGAVTNWGGDDAVSVEQVVPWVAPAARAAFSSFHHGPGHRLPAQPRRRQADIADRPLQGRVAGRLRRMSEEQFPGRLAQAGRQAPPAGGGVT